MHLLYVDESGGDDPNSKDSYFVLGALSAFERVPYHLSRELDEIQREFFPSVVEPVEFRASAIWNGNGEPWKSMERPIRRRLMERIYRVLSQERTGVVLFGLAMRKADYPATPAIQRCCEELAGTLMHTLVPSSSLTGIPTNSVA